MIDRWDIVGLLRDLMARDQHSGVIAFAEDGVASWASATVADKALRLARGLQDAGFRRDSRVAIWAPNSPVWIVAALAILAAGGVVVPIDDLADAEQFEAALTSGSVWLIFTTAHHLEASSDILRVHAARVILVDEPEDARQSATSWLSVLGERTDDLPVPGLDQPALLSWTSGTTGSPKAFLLTHRNIATNIEALRELAVVGPQDRALLPLPLHHAYPFIVGMLTTLTIGTAIVLPGGTTGPHLMRAMREGEVTTIIGVPRLYDALWTAIETRVTTHGATVRLIWRALMDRLWQMNGWLTREARFLDTNLELFRQFCMKHLELGVLLDRSWLHIRALHPQYGGRRGCGRGRLVSRSGISTMALRRRAPI